MLQILVFGPAESAGPDPPPALPSAHRDWVRRVALAAIEFRKRCARETSLSIREAREHLFATIDKGV